MKLIFDLTKNHWCNYGNQIQNEVRKRLNNVKRINLADRKTLTLLAKAFKKGSIDPTETSRYMFMRSIYQGLTRVEYLGDTQLINNIRNRIITVYWAGLRDVDAGLKKVIEIFESFKLFDSSTSLFQTKLEFTKGEDDGLHEVKHILRYHTGSLKVFDLANYNHLALLRKATYYMMNYHADDFYEIAVRKLSNGVLTMSTSMGNVDNWEKNLIKEIQRLGIKVKNLPVKISKAKKTGSK